MYEHYFLTLVAPLSLVSAAFVLDLARRWTEGAGDLLPPAGHLRWSPGRSRGSRSSNNGRRKSDIPTNSPEAADARPSAGCALRNSTWSIISWRLSGDRRRSASPFFISTASDLRISSSGVDVPRHRRDHGETSKFVVVTQTRRDMTARGPTAWRRSTAASKPTTTWSDRVDDRRAPFAIYRLRGLRLSRRADRMSES